MKSNTSTHSTRASVLFISESRATIRIFHLLSNFKLTFDKSADLIKNVSKNVENLKECQNIKDHPIKTTSITLSFNWAVIAHTKNRDSIIEVLRTIQKYLSNECFCKNHNNKGFEREKRRDFCLFVWCHHYAQCFTLSRAYWSEFIHRIKIINF